MKNDGGSAFPYHIDESAIHVMDFPGMTLRDWFAGQALAGMLANPSGPIQANGMSGWNYCNCTADSIACEAHQIAEAMLAAREGRDE